MSIKSRLKRIVAPKIGEYGFVYDEKESRKGKWCFSKKINEVIQLIAFEKSNFTPNALRVEFRTTFTYRPIWDRDLVEEKLKKSVVGIYRRRLTRSSSS